MADSLPKNATLVELVADGRLVNPRRYLRLALANMLLAGDYGTVFLRIGVTGIGERPQYALEQKGKIIGRFGGTTHKPWEGENAYNEEKWSTDSISAAELHALLQEIAADA